MPIDGDRPEGGDEPAGSADAPRASASTRRWLRLALVGLSVALALGVAEAFLRVRDLAPAVSRIGHSRYRIAQNPKLGFEPVPERVVAQDTGPLEDFVGTSNSLGFRDREHAVEKPAGVKRIVVLGDSVAAGLKVAMTRDVFAAVLERLLRERGDPAEVINLSVHGYNTQQEVEMLIERGLQFSPDVVVLAYTLSDRERLDGNIYETLLRARDGGEPVAPTWRTRSWVMRSALARTLAYRVFPPPAAPRLEPEVEAKIARALDEISGDTVASSFSRLRDLADANHFRVLVAVFPYLVHNARSYSYGTEHNFVRRLSRARGFDHRDLLGPLRRCGGGRSFDAVRADWAHLNERGHACVARALAAALSPILAGRPAKSAAKAKKVGEKR